MASETIKRVRLGEVFDLQMGKTPARADSSFWGGGHKWISIADIGKADVYISETKETISDAAISASGIRPIPKDTLIMSFKLSVGKVAITAEEMFSNEAIVSFRDLGKHELDLHYLFHQFKNKDWSGGMNKAVMGATLNKASLKCHEILLHPLAVQRRIAATLDKISEMKRNAEARLQKLDLLVKARFNEMFGDLVANPFKWKFVQLGDVCDVRDGTHASPKYHDVGYPLMTSKNFSSGAEDFSDVKLISEEDYIEINKRSKVDVGDIVMPMIGTIGHPVIIRSTRPFAIKNVSLIKFRTDEFSNVFVKAVLDSAYFQKVIEEKNRGNTQKFIALGDIRGLLMPCVPQPLQRSFAAFVEKVEALKATAQASLERVDLLYRAKLQEYFG